MPRVLIVYSTRAGSTSHVANLLSNQFRALGHDVSVASASADPVPSGEDLFVVGSGILASHWNSEALQWLTRHEADIEGRTALFNVCLNAKDPVKRPEALAYNAEASSIVEPLDSEAFAGKFKPQQVGFWQRHFMRFLRQKTQDHIDPAAIAGWARKLHEEHMAG